MNEMEGGRKEEAEPMTTTTTTRNEEDEEGENEMIRQGKTELKIKQPTKETDDYVAKAAIK